MVKGKIKVGEYFDSVSLMIVAGKMRSEKNVIDSSIVMGTAENKAILKAANLLISEFDDAKDSDLLIVVSAKSSEDALNVIEKSDEFLKELKNKKQDDASYSPKSLEAAAKQFDHPNLALISVAGKFAVGEAFTALDNGMNVMLFSDNISIDDELMLKKKADDLGLIVMGPDCGTAIISGAPLAFANSVNRGNIGIVAASGTGLQEVSSLITNFGKGISHAIGTGGRDVKEAIGGISFLRGIKMLMDDESTEKIVLISKPPHQSVLKKVKELLKGCKKTVISIFLGAKNEEGFVFANTLEEAALLACEEVTSEFLISCDQLKKRASVLKKELKSEQKYLRALYSGGTFCSETQIILEKNGIQNLFSNAPTGCVSKLEDSLVSSGNTIIDLGEDEFTAGRPHPMIDFSLRNMRLLEEVKKEDVALILMDLVIGYGASMNPQDEFLPSIKRAREINPALPIICFVTGTDKDLQNKKQLESELKKMGVELVYSNAQAACLAGEILKEMN